MPKRSRKQFDDVNILAKRIVEETTKNPPEIKEPQERPERKEPNQTPPERKEPPQNPPPERKDPPEKNPAAVALGRLGGLKGGKARAKTLSAEKRKAIARKAANARWGKK